METSDEYGIQERTGIKERRFADRLGETTTTMGCEAAKERTERAGTTAKEIDFIIFATLSPDYYFPGCGSSLATSNGNERNWSSGYQKPMFRLYLRPFCCRSIYKNRHV